MSRIFCITVAIVFGIAWGLAISSWAQTVSPPVNPCAMAGAYNATPQTITTGNFGLVQVDVNGKLVIAP